MASDETGSGGGNPQFLTSGTSALILAFLAIGLFVGGLLVMFAMRRYVVASRRRAGAWVPAGGGPWAWDDGRVFRTEPLFFGGDESRRREMEFSAKPELYDVHSLKPASDDWRDIVPIHVSKEIKPITAVPEDRTRQAQVSSEETHGDDPPPGFFRPLTIGVHEFVSRIRSPRRRAQPPPPESSSPPAAQTSTQAPTTDPAYIRVVLAIVMPTLQQNGCSVPQYALGITSVQLEGSEDPGQEM
ncbi:hypothetical protein BC628DRAFT_1505340 [Trametes gibbosa]|nr:hypothetical protein BC628DRAFT_1505340 [Trametes gibbosa]